MPSGQLSTTVPAPNPASSFVRMVFALSVMVSCTAPTVRAAAAPESGGDADILPYLDETTFLVARVDIARVDHEAFDQFFERMTLAVFSVMPIPANQRPMVEQEAKQSAGEVKQWLTDMAAAGGKRIYFVMGTDTFSSDGEPVMVVPVEGGADVAAITDVMQRGPGKPEDVAELGKAVVLARASERERIQKNFEPGAAAPAERPHLAAAMKAAGDAPMRIAFLPDETTRGWIEGSLPKVPEALGGAETAVLSRGVRWAAAGVAQKPDTVARMTVQAENAEHAKALMDMLTKSSAFLQLAAPPAPPADDPAAAEAAAKKAADAMTPKLNGETITLSVDPIAIQVAVMRAQMQQMLGGGAAPPPPPPAAPAKPDDGGL